MPNPMVTAVMPTYNRPEFVAHAVNLFQQQRYSRKELLILDDSPRAQSTKQFGSNVRYIRYPDRVLMAKKHNDALQLAQGELLVHWDDDDWSAPMRITRQVEPIMMLGVDVVGLKLWHVLNSGQFTMFAYTNKKPLPAGTFIGPVGNSLGGRLLGFHDGTALFRRSVIGDASYGAHQVSQKVIFLNRLIDSGAKKYVLENQGLFVYVRHGTNTWQFGDALRLVPSPTPKYFPKEELEFYRACAS